MFFLSFFLSSSSSLLLPLILSTFLSPCHRLNWSLWSRHIKLTSTPVPAVKCDAVLVVLRVKVIFKQGDVMTAKAASPSSSFALFSETMTEFLYLKKYFRFVMPEGDKRRLNRWHRLEEMKQNKTKMF
jgi:hypothetical protein